MKIYQKLKIVLTQELGSDNRILFYYNERRYGVFCMVEVTSTISIINIDRGKGKMAKDYLVSKYQMVLIEKHIQQGDFDAANKIMNQILNPAPKVKIGEVELLKLQESLNIKSPKSAEDTLTIIKTEIDIKEMKQLLYSQIEQATNDETRELFKKNYQEMSNHEKEFKSLAERYEPKKDEMETLFTTQNRHRGR